MDTDIFRVCNLECELLGYSISELLSRRDVTKASTSPGTLRSVHATTTAIVTFVIFTQLLLMGWTVNVC